MFVISMFSMFVIRVWIVRFDMHDNKFFMISVSVRMFVGIDDRLFSDLL